MGSCCSVCGGSYSNRVYPEPIINTRENASGQEQKADSISESKEKEIGNIVLYNEEEKEKKDVVLLNEAEKEKKVDFSSIDETESEDISINLEGNENEDNFASMDENESEDISINLEGNENEDNFSSMDENDSVDDTIFHEGNQSLFMTEDKRQFMKSITLERGEKVYICGDIEGNYLRLLKVFEHIYGSTNIFQDGYTLLPFPPGVRIIFLGDLLTRLKIIKRKKENRNTQKILSFINANFDLFHHVQYSDGKIEDILDEIKEKIFSSFIIPDAKIFVIEGNHDLEYFNVISDQNKYSEEIKSCPLLSNLKYSHLIKFISLLDQTTIQILHKTQEKPKYLFSHYPPYKQIPGKTDKMILFKRSFGLIPSTIDFKTHQIIHGHSLQHKIIYLDKLQFDPISYDYSYQKEFFICLLDSSKKGITMNKVDLSIRNPPVLQSKKGITMNKVDLSIRSPPVLLSKKAQKKNKKNQKKNYKSRKQRKEQNP